MDVQPSQADQMVSLREAKEVALAGCGLEVVKEFNCIGWSLDTAKGLFVILF